MSIVALKKLTLFGLDSDKKNLLQELQKIGCLHLIPFNNLDESQEESISSTSMNALKFLLNSPYVRKQEYIRDDFDAVKVEKKVLAIMQKLKKLQDEKDFLQHRINELSPWGEFSFPDVEALDGWRLWFYRLSHIQYKSLMSSNTLSNYYWQLIKKDNRFVYFVIMNQSEPKDIPFHRVLTGNKSASELRRLLHEVETDIEDTQAERISLSRWSMLLASSINALNDLSQCERAADEILDCSPVFALQAWIPVNSVETIQQFAKKKQVYCRIDDPLPEDQPPTFFKNPEYLAGGESLVNFYLTPGYWTWDPSAIVLVSFAVFFAMIIADAGYAIIFAILLASLWRKLSSTQLGKSLRFVFSIVVITSFIYGVLAGSYFGTSPPEGTWFYALKLFDVTQSEFMMSLSILLGVIHVSLANIMRAISYGGRKQALAPLGWGIVSLSGFAFAIGVYQSAMLLQFCAGLSLVLGLSLILLFTHQDGNRWTRFLYGLLSLTSIINVFGDIMSYLRLFALGLASASLAIAFNDMALDVRESFPGIGLLLSILILVIGHGLNLLLGLMSAVVHGLRLNFIEFFNWGLTEEGRLFKAFKRKEDKPWKP